MTLQDTKSGKTIGWLAQTKKQLHSIFINTISVQEAAFRWLESIRPRVKESTYNKYTNMLKWYILPLLGKLPITDIDHMTVEVFANELLECGSCKQQALSPKTVSDTLSVLREVLRYAAKQNYDITHEIGRISLRKHEKPMCVFSPEEQKQLTDYLQNHLALRNIGILLCLYTGIRIGEVCAVQWKNIQTESETITIKQTLQRVQNKGMPTVAKTKIVITEPKSTCSLRTIPLPHFLAGLLQQQPHTENSFLLSGTETEMVEPRNLQIHFKRILKQANIREVNFHALRHTFATRCVELGFDLKSLSEILGHANVNITLDKYVHPSMDLKRSNMEKLHNLLQTV